MRHLLIAGIMVLAVAGMAAAQDFPKIELFGGFSILKLGGPDLAFSVFNKASGSLPSTLNEVSNKLLERGGTFSIAYNIKSDWGAELAYQYNNGNIMDIYGSWDTFDWGTRCCEITNGRVRSSDFSVMAGPRYTIRKRERITPFVHALVGLNRFRIKPSLWDAGKDRSSLMNLSYNHDNAIGFMIGGGLDVKATKLLSVRVIQLDYFQAMNKIVNMNAAQGGNPKSDLTLNNLMISFGVVYRWENPRLKFW
jgi:opacity protein-like surface antigen